MREHSVEAEEVKHGAVGMESVAKGRARSEVVEEGEERGGGETETGVGERVKDVLKSTP